MQPGHRCRWGVIQVWRWQRDVGLADCVFIGECAAGVVTMARGAPNRVPGGLRMDADSEIRSGEAVMQPGKSAERVISVVACIICLTVMRWTALPVAGVIQVCHRGDSTFCHPDLIVPSRTGLRHSMFHVERLGDLEDRVMGCSTWNTIRLARFGEQSQNGVALRKVLKLAVNLEVFHRRPFFESPQLVLRRIERNYCIR